MAPIFSIFIDAYHGATFFQQSARSVLDQSYTNFELIIVNNGALYEVSQEIDKIAKADERVRVINFKINQFTWDDPHIVVDKCWNAALRAARGEYIFHLSYDDFLSPNFLERMIALFDENPRCTSASGMMEGVDIHGNVIAPVKDEKPMRPKFMAGHKLALDTLKGGGMLVAAGDIFVVRTKDLINGGGYHRAIEDSILFGIIPFGETGFDSTAKLYWRRHEEQLNKQLNAAGWLGYIDYTKSLIKEWCIEEKWQQFGGDLAKHVAYQLLKKEWHNAGAQAAANLSEINVLGFYRMAYVAGLNRFFWRTFLQQLWLKRRQLASCVLKKLGLHEFFIRLLKSKNS